MNSIGAWKTLKLPACFSKKLRKFMYSSSNMLINLSFVCKFYEYFIKQDFMKEVFERMTDNSHKNMQSMVNATLIENSTVYSQ